jgi:hypothetical protein
MKPDTRLNRLYLSHQSLQHRQTEIFLRMKMALINLMLSHIYNCDYRQVLQGYYLQHVSLLQSVHPQRFAGAFSAVSDFCWWASGLWACARTAASRSYL